MSVFLRWGVFAILGVAALLYAYNASKRMSEAQARKAAVTAPAEGARTDADGPTPATQAEDERYAAPPQEPARAAPAHCEAELAVARRALDMKRQGEPLDRVLRIQEIAWQDGPQRQRLETVAARWYGYESDFSPEALRIAVISDCQRAAPAP